MKKVWMILSVFSALICGMFLYEGAVLFFRYTDRRMGLLVAACGAAAAVLFVFCIFESFNTGNWTMKTAGRLDESAESMGEEKSGNACAEVRTEYILTIIAFGCAGAGLLLYGLRFHAIFQVYLYILAYAACVLLIAAVGVLRTMPGRLKEEELKRQVLSRKAFWAENGWTAEDKTAVRLLRIFIESKTAVLQIWGGSSILLIVMLLKYIGTGSGRWLSGVLVYIAVNLAVQSAAVIKSTKQAVCVLNQGDTKQILGFFAGYYERAGGRLFSLLPEIQSYAAAALCDQEAYGEALALLEKIRWKPRAEAFFQQYAWISFWGLGDREGCSEAMSRMEASLHLLKGKSLALMQETVRLFRDFQEGRYDEVIQAAQADGRTVLQQRTRQRLAEAARREKAKKTEKPMLTEKNEK